MLTQRHPARRRPPSGGCGRAVQHGPRWRRDRADRPRRAGRRLLVRRRRHRGQLADRHRDVRPPPRVSQPTVSPGTATVPASTSRVRSPGRGRRRSASSRATSPTGTGSGRLSPPRSSTAVTRPAWSRTSSGRRGAAPGPSRPATSEYVGPNQSVASGTEESATVVAFDLGTCDGKLHVPGHRVVLPAARPDLQPGGTRTSAPAATWAPRSRRARHVRTGRGGRADLASRSPTRRLGR